MTSVLALGMVTACLNNGTGARIAPTQEVNVRMGEEVTDKAVSEDRHATAVNSPTLIVCKAPVWNNVFFDAGKSSLRADAKTDIDKIVAELKKHPKDTLTIIGHTSDDEVTPQTKPEQDLGLRRAGTVRAYMVAQGIEPERIETTTKGSDRPVVPNSSATYRKLNRRVQFVMKTSD